MESRRLTHAPSMYDERMVAPMPGLGEADRRVWRYSMIYPNTTIDLYPDQVVTWLIDPYGPMRSRDEAFGYRHPGAGARSRILGPCEARVRRDAGAARRVRSHRAVARRRGERVPGA